MASGTKISALSTTSILSGGEVFPLVQSGTTKNTTITALFSAPVIITPKIQDTSADHQYSVAVSELAANRTVTLPLLSGNDTFVFEAHTQTLTNKTLTSPAITGGTVDNAVIGGTTAAAITGTVGTFTGSLNAGVGTLSTGVDLQSRDGLLITSSVAALSVNGLALDYNVGTARIATNIAGGGTIDFFTTSIGGNRQFRIAHTGSAVNYWNITGAGTGIGVGLSALGSDTNVGTGFGAKGAGTHDFYTDTFSARQFRVSHVASAVNYLQVYGQATGSSPAIEAVGSDAAIDIELRPKSASGRVRYGTHSAIGAETVTGYITIKDLGGTERKLAVVS